MRLRSPGELADVVGLRSVFGIHDPLVEGSHESRRAAEAEERRRLRLEHARGNPRWTEIAPTDLVRRGPFLVDAETGELFQRRRHVYANGTPTGPINEADCRRSGSMRTGEPIFVGQPASGPKTIEELTRRQADRETRGRRTQR